MGVLLAGGIGGALHLTCIRQIKLPVKSRLMRCAIQDNILIRYMGERNVPVALADNCNVTALFMEWLQDVSDRLINFPKNQSVQDWKPVYISSVLCSSI